ncbi:M16 family metallopeptidase [Hymenobacter humi]|uniref:M16 family metallopeptidase n=1 Tax=Hymenobacter humi TaxID=1411620 RepID=A0ABW2UB78_9BACT
MDSDFRKQYEALNAALYPTHPYGTQTTIGTIEHLQNPSITEIKKYFGQYYVPNNVALCLSGDLDYDATIRLIDKYFGTLPTKPVPAFNAPVEKPLSAPLVREVVGPQAENVMLGFRLPGKATRDGVRLRMLDKILTNGQAGLIDLDLNQQQKVLQATSFTDLNTDYSTHVIYGNPRQGQKLDEVKSLLLAELAKVKAGNFPDWLIPAIINNDKLERTKSYESNEARASAMYEAFIQRVDWKDYLQQQETFASITKEEIVKFANDNYGENYVTVYKRTGTDPNKVKVVKPAITPVPANRDAASTYYKQITAMQARRWSRCLLTIRRTFSRRPSSPACRCFIPGTPKTACSTCTTSWMWAPTTTRAGAWPPITCSTSGPVSTRRRSCSRSSTNWAARLA